MLEDYFYNEISPKFFILLARDRTKLTVDSDDFVVIDGEESDYGILRYYFNGELVATKTVEGGDIEDTVYTDFGKKLFNGIISNLLADTLAE